MKKPPTDVSDLGSCPSQPNQLIEISDFSLQNASDVYEMYFRVLSTKGRRLFSPYPLFSSPCDSLPDFENRIRSWLEERDWRMRLLYVDGYLAGFGILKRMNEVPTTGVLVIDKWQGNGFGRSIMNDIIQLASDLHLLQLNATIEDSNTMSIKLHESLGFKPEKEYKKHRVFDGSNYHVISARRYLKIIE